MTRIVADPELAARAREAGAAEVLVLGGGGEERDLGRGVIDMERIDPDAVEPPAWYRPEPGPRPRPRVHPLHRRGRAHPRQPDHERALGAVGVRDRVGRGALRRRHGLRGDADLPPLGAADEHRRRDRRRRAAGDGARLRPGDVLGRGAPLRDHGRLLHLDDAARDRRRPGRTRASATTRSGCSSAPGCRAGSGAGSSAASPRRACSSSTRSTEGEAILVNLSGEKPGCKGRPLPGSAEVRLAAYDFADGPAARARRRLRGRVRAGRGRDAADPAARRRLDQREPAARRVRARRRLARDRRPVPRRRRRRPVAGRPRRRR